MLSDVSDDQVGVLPDFSSLVRLSLSDQKLDESRFSGSVRSENSDSRRERDLQRNVVDCVRVASQRNEQSTQKRRVEIEMRTVNDRKRSK